MKTKEEKAAYLAGQWRSVEDELPPTNTLVFVMRGIGSIPETSFHIRNGIFTAPIGGRSDAVTHWMFIPEIPEPR